MSTVSAQAIEDSLKQCMDPEVPLNIVEMGLIYGIDVSENNDVNIKMTMTTQGCPLHETLVQDATRYVKKSFLQTHAKKIGTISPTTKK